MKTWIRLHRLALANAIRLMFRTPLATVLNFLAIGIQKISDFGIWLYCSFKSITGKFIGINQKTS